MVVGVFFNALFFFFPRQLAGMFITAGDPNYELFMEFATLMCHSFLLVMALNALEITCSTSIQSLGKVKKATVLALLRQLILLIPISLTLAIAFKKGIYGILYAGAISDTICFIVAIILISTEFASLKNEM